MAKVNIAQLPGKLYDLLKDLEFEERQRVVAATLLLFGDPPANSVNVNSVVTPPIGGTTGSGIPTAKSYMDKKDPQNKGEMLAVAARFRELYEEAETHTKEQIQKIFSDARRNFDSGNYARDMKNTEIKPAILTKILLKGWRRCLITAKIMLMLSPIERQQKH